MFTGEGKVPTNNQREPTWDIDGNVLIVINVTNLELILIFIQ